MKGYTALSLLGLIISLSGTVIISRYLYQEWTIDHFMPALDRTFLCCVQLEGEGDWRPMETFDPNHESQFVSPVLNQSDVECWTNIHLREMYAVTPEKGETFYPQALSVDSAFAQVYPLEAVEGTLKLRAKGQCMVSKELAARLFPGESAVGKTITVGDGDVNTVVGVFRQPSTKSSIRFDIADFADEDFYAPHNSIAIGVVRLSEGASVSDYNKRQPEQRLAMFEDRPIRYGLQPYTQELQKNFTKGYWGEFDCAVHSASAAHLWMLLFVAMLLLGVGLFNFVNLFAVMRSHRRHELHVRRLFGASRWDVFAQLYAETFLVALLTMIGVWTIVELAEPLLATYYNIKVMFQWKFDVGLTLAVIFGLPLIASSIPTNSFHSLREGVGVGLQFFISLALLTVSIYFMRQLHVMLTADPGFRTKGLLNAVIYPPSNRGSWTQDEFYAMIERKKSQAEVVQQRLQALPYLKGIDVNEDFINGSFPVGLADGSSIDMLYITGGAARMFGLQLVEGVLPDDSLSMEDYACVANEAAIKALGIKNRETDLVQFADRIFWTAAREKDNPPYRIVGVVRDFNTGRQSEPVRPLILMFEKWEKDFRFDARQMEGRNYLLDVAEGHEDDIIRELKDLEMELFGTSELRYQWVEDQRQELYREDQRTARIFVTFSLLAIAVTCLGVLGLMMFDVRRRYREIALRKVHGARFRDIALLLSRRYLIILGLAAAVSIPVSLIGLHRLITRYYTIHASVAWWIPFVSLVIVFLLSALTLWYQIWRATRIEPSVVMKVEQ